MKSSEPLGRPAYGPRRFFTLASFLILPPMFWLDRVMPLGLAVGMLYAIPVLLTLWSSRRITTTVTALATLLTVTDIWLSPPEAITWVVLTNRGFSLVVIWTVMLLVVSRQRAERAVVQAHAGLERQVEERTAHLNVLNRDLQQAIAEREISEQHLRQIIDLVPHRIFVKDAEGRFLLVNRAVAMAYGTEVEALIGRRQADLHADQRQLERMQADDRSVITAGEARTEYTETFTDRDGRQRVLRTIKIPYRLPDQEQCAVLGLAIDITADIDREMRLEASERKYRALLENAVDAIILSDAEGRLLDVNRRAEDLLGYGREELRRMNALDLHPASEHERVRQAFRDLKQFRTTRFLHPVLRKDGTVLQVEVAATPIHIADDMIVFQGIFRDVTEHERQAEERLKQERLYRDTLVREVHHRIKNNLQGVVGLLRERAGAQPELTGLIDTAIAQVQSISVVYGLHGRGEDRQICLCEIVGAIVRNTRALTQARVAMLAEDAGPYTTQVHENEAVPLALVINELVMNAIKHGGGPSPPPSVRIVVEQGEAQAAVRVFSGGRLPAGFDYGQGLGLRTGLGLVRSLLPHEGAELSFTPSDEGVEACLRLAAPVVSMIPGGYCATVLSEL